MLKKEKVWNLMGLVLGLVILIVGIVFAVTPPDSYSTTSTEYASFGGDYYTYEYDATRAAASNAAVTANNLREIGAAQAKYFGFLFITVGALTMVSYGKKYFTEDAEEAPAAVPEDVSQPETVEAELPVL